MLSCEVKRPRADLIDAALDYLVFHERPVNYIDVAAALRDSGFDDVVSNFVWNALESGWNVGLFRKYVPSFNDRPKYQWAGAPEVDWEGWSLAARRIDIEVVLEAVQELGEANWWDIKTHPSLRFRVDDYVIQRALDDAWRVGWIKKRRVNNCGVYKWIGRKRMNEEQKKW